MHTHSHTDEQFPTGTTDLELATEPETVEIADGGAFDLRIAPVKKQLGDATVRMLAYNGSVPGPTLKVAQGSEVIVNVENRGDLEATVHWHGLRLDNRYDGTHETQEPIPVSGPFAYRLDRPDPGVYLDLPPIRGDYGQALGLHVNIPVVPAQADYWPPAHRELTLTLDDVLIEDGKIAPFGNETNYSAMGRFGNVMLVNGETDILLDARPGEVVRLYLTNTANTRVFNVTLPGARIKLVGGDSGRCEHEQLVESVIVAPSERVVVDVRFEAPAEVALEHRTPERKYTLATFDVAGDPATRLSEEFATLRHNTEWIAERERLQPYFDAPPDKTLAFVAELNLGEPGEASVYTCPMHPDVVSDGPGTCPRCGMKLLPAGLVTAAGHGAQGEAHGHDGHHGHGHHHHAADDEATRGIEWEDDMVDVNRITTSENTRWKLVDKDTGDANHAIAWRFRVGDRVKLRLVNELESDHPMHHPFHVHGAGRFVVLARDGAPEENLVWKDTVLVRTGETVDILLDVTNPGIWMAHCHIAEHHESGMMFSFTVDPATV